MGLHEDFLELCAAATAGELNVEEQARLDAHLAVCPECRRARSEYETEAVKGVAALAEDLGPKDQEGVDNLWSVEKAQESFFRRFDKEQENRESSPATDDQPDRTKTGQRFTYRPSQIRWRGIWMPFAAAVLLALALGIAAYRTGVKRGTDASRTLQPPAKESASSLKEQASDAGYERAQWIAKLAENSKVIDDLKHQLSEQAKVVKSLKSTEPAPARS